MKARILLLLSLCALVPTAALSQALTSLASVRVGYTTRKNTVKPQGDLKAQIHAQEECQGDVAAMNLAAVSAHGEPVEP